MGQTWLRKHEAHYLAEVNGMQAIKTRDPGMPPLHPPHYPLENPARRPGRRKRQQPMLPEREKRAKPKPAPLPRPEVPTPRDWGP